MTRTIRITETDAERITNMTDEELNWAGKVRVVVDRAEKRNRRHAND